jgi:WhiB family transcriptional regulator, redox-sensing transcriptional regulator
MSGLQWMHRAACRPGSGVDPELFFPIGAAGPALTQIGEAQQVCSPCPVSAECLGYSLRAPGEPVYAGVWGGVGEDERRLVKRRRNRHLSAVA